MERLWLDGYVFSVSFFGIGSEFVCGLIIGWLLPPALLITSMCVHFIALIFAAPRVLGAATCCHLSAIVTLIIHPTRIEPTVATKKRIPDLLLLFPLWNCPPNVKSPRFTSPTAKSSCWIHHSCTPFPFQTHIHPHHCSISSPPHSRDSIRARAPRGTAPATQTHRKRGRWCATLRHSPERKCSPWS